MAQPSEVAKGQGLQRHTAIVEGFLPHPYSSMDDWCAPTSTAVFATPCTGRSAAPAGSSGRA